MSQNYAVPAAAPLPATPDPGEGSRSFVTTWLLSLFLGAWGVDRFYLGKAGTGLLKLLTIGGFGIWVLVDLIIVLTGAARDKQGHRLRGYQENKVVAWIVTGALWLLGAVIGGISAIVGAAGTASSIADAAASATAQATAIAEPSATPEATVVVPVVEESSPAEETAAPEQTTVPEQTTEETLAQRNARESAEAYLAFTAFSRSGLIEQLEFEGFETADAEYAVRALRVDWNAQAVEKGQSYLDFASFSYSGLIDQLEYEGFTSAQAKYGADRVVVDWNEQAVLKAESYLEFTTFSRSGLIDQLEYEGFTSAQARYAADEVGF